MTLRHPSVLLAAGLVLATSACSDEARNPLAPSSPEDSADATLAPLHRTGGTAVPNSYIVVLKEGASPSSVASAAGVQPRFSYGVEKSAAGEATATPTPGLNGFATELDATELSTIRANPQVAYVEEDQVLTADEVQLMSGSYGDPWGLDRLDQRSLSLSRSYAYGEDGAGVYAYVVDSGIQTSHPEFGGRAKNVYDAFGKDGSDCKGHGTKVAGIIGGKTWGVAKKVSLMGVKVLDCYGKGTTSRSIAALDWVRANRRNPAVLNMSYGGSYSAALNDATARLVSSGVFVAVSAGNNGGDACKYSPSSAAGAFTTAASNERDGRVSYSNYGSCVDGYAPGYNIMTSAKGSSTALSSGTSMASPHVAGVGALYKGRYGNASSATVDNWIKKNATTGKITSNPSGTPNRLLYSPLVSTASTSPSPSSSWSFRDVGSVSPAGATVVGSGSLTVSGSGSDIWGNMDAFHFSYQPLHGDGEIVARVASQTSTSSWAKAGVMIRGSMYPASKYAAVLLTPSNGVKMQHRSQWKEITSSMSGGSGRAPVWVRLVRRGNKLTGYRSADGSSWTQIGSAYVELASDIYMGLAVTSHANGKLSTARFENVRVEA